AVIVTAGRVVFLTVMVKGAVLRLPSASVGVHVTVVAPIGNVAPLAGVQVTATLPSKASTADAVYVNAAPVGPVASALALAGMVITGAVVSVTVTVNVFVEAFA